MTATETLLREIEAFSLEVGMRPSTISRKAVNDGKLPSRLRVGGQVTLETAERLRAYMAEHRAARACTPPQPEHGRAA